MGRNPKTAAEKKSNILRIMLTERDRAAIDKAAKAAGLDSSTFVRVKILEMIRANKANKG